MNTEDVLIEIDLTKGEVDWKKAKEKFFYFDWKPKMIHKPKEEPEDFLSKKEMIL